MHCYLQQSVVTALTNVSCIKPAESARTVNVLNKNNHRLSPFKNCIYEVQNTYVARPYFVQLQQRRWNIKLLLLRLWV